ncbi:MAG: RagB/SusD family nutrient uptake outer membrane protein, partial [Chitinophagaceae bacterium]
YGGVPIVANSLASTADFNALKRSSFDECAQWIAKQCDTAALLMNDVVRRRNNDIGRATKAFALAVKSRTLLYNASPLNNPSGDMVKWKAAADAAKQILDLVDQGYYALYNDYYSMFIQQDKGVTDQNFKEVIFQLPRNNGHFNNVNSIAFGKGFKAGTCPSQELVDAYPMKNGEQPVLGYSDADKLVPILNPASGYDPANPYLNRDPRFAASIFYNGSFWGKQNGQDHYVESFVGGSDGLRDDRNYTRTGYYIKKYIDPTAGNGFANQAPATAQAYWIIFRLAEFYLNYAEALNEASGPVAEVYTAVNKIRTRAGIPNLPAGLSKEQMRERVRTERRVELAFEEHRFYDVRRWKILKDTDKLVTGLKITKTGSVLAYERIVVERRTAWDDKFLQFPIPINDLSKMTGVQQTPGW